jgi:hypothetical protein
VGGWGKGQDGGSSQELQGEPTQALACCGPALCCCRLGGCRRWGAVYQMFPVCFYVCTFP